MLLASATPVKKIQIINGDMVLTDLNNEEKIIPNSVLKFYSVEDLNISTEKSNNYVVRI